MKKLWLVIILPLCAGCPPFLRPVSDKGPPPMEVPTAARLVDYLNENSSRIQSAHFQSVGLTPTVATKMGPQSMKLTAQIMVQKPRNFRMTGDMSGTPFVDLGSNDNEFWWWIGELNKSNPSYQYYCSYQDLNAGRARINIPLQPEWVIEVLGMGTYGPPQRYTVEHDAETVRLVEKALINGKSVRKVIVFQRRPKQLPEPMVSDFQLYEDVGGRSGKLICSAHISKVHLDSNNTNAYLPQRIEIDCPGYKAKLTLDLPNVNVNPGLTKMLANNTSVRNPGNPVPLSAFIRQPRDGFASVNLASESLRLPTTADAGR